MFLSRSRPAATIMYNRLYARSARPRVLYSRSLRLHCTSRQSVRVSQQPHRCQRHTSPYSEYLRHFLTCVVYFEAPFLCVPLPSVSTGGAIATAHRQLQVSGRARLATFPPSRDPLAFLGRRLLTVASGGVPGRWVQNHLAHRTSSTSRTSRTCRASWPRQMGRFRRSRRRPGR